MEVGVADGETLPAQVAAAFISGLGAFASQSIFKYRCTIIQAPFGGLRALLNHGHVYEIEPPPLPLKKMDHTMIFGEKYQDLHA